MKKLQYKTLLYCIVSVSKLNKCFAFAAFARAVTSSLALLNGKPAHTEYMKKNPIISIKAYTK